MSTEFGDIELRNITVNLSDYFTMNNENKPSPDELVGQLINNTKINDGTFKMKVSVLDSNGYMKKEDTFTVLSSGRNNNISQPLPDLYGDVFIESGDSISVDVLGGQYPVDYSFRLISPKGQSNTTYETDSLSIRFAISTDGIGFSMKNKISEPIKIIWNEASYVDIRGSSNKVIHSGIEYSERNRSIPPTTIPPKASTEQVVLPSSNITTIGGEWVEEPLFPHSETFGYRSDSEYIGGTEEYVGKEFSLFLPLEVGGKDINYNFRFRVEDVGMDR